MGSGWQEWEEVSLPGASATQEAAGQGSSFAVADPLQPAFRMQTQTQEPMLPHFPPTPTTGLSPLPRPGSRQGASEDQATLLARLPGRLRGFGSLRPVSRAVLPGQPSGKGHANRRTSQDTDTGGAPSESPRAQATVGQWLKAGLGVGIGLSELTSTPGFPNSHPCVRKGFREHWKEASGA